jgi:hypothetical protein
MSSVGSPTKNHAEGVRQVLRLDLRKDMVGEVNEGCGAGLWRCASSFCVRQSRGVRWVLEDDQECHTENRQKTVFFTGS